MGEVSGLGCRAWNEDLERNPQGPGEPYDYMAGSEKRRWKMPLAHPVTSLRPGAAAQMARFRAGFRVSGLGFAV